MKVYDRPRLACCVVSALVMAAHAAPAGLVGFWDFNEGTGATVYDYTVNNNEGALMSIGGGVPTWIAGHSGASGDHALHFSQGNVTVPDSASLHITSRFTLAAWYYDIGSNYGHIFVAGDGGAGGRTWLLQTSAYGGDAAYYWSATGNTEFNHSLGFVPPLNAWHHIAITYDGSHMRNYIDGTQVGATAAISSALDTWGTLRLGGFTVNGSGFDGRLDDMVIFNTVEDVTSIMNGTHPAMLGHWTGGGTGPAYGWSDAANWGGTLPKYTRPLVFDAANGLTSNTNDFPANRAFKGITFLSSAGAFTLNGNSVNLTGDVVNNSTNTQTIALTGGLVLDGSRDCSFAAAAGAITVTGGIRAAPGQTCGVIKSGANRVSLAGDLTYSGDTTIGEGLLALGSANPDNDDSTVSIAGGARLELNFGTGTTDRVASLFIDGAPMSNGVYGSVASGAANPDDSHFAGLGTLTVAAAPRSPATFYVSQSGGSDTNGGTSAADPWKTLAKASSVSLIPGDRLLLRGGDTWNEVLQPKGNGTAANPILIGSYGSDSRPIINRGDAAQQNGIHLIDQEGYKIVGIEFSHCETGIWAEYHVNQPVRDFLWIEDCYFHDSLRYGTYYDYYNAKNISVGISLWTFVSWSTNISLQNVTVTNCTFRRMASAFWTNSPDNFDYFADNFYNFANVNILDCLFEEGYQWQLGFRGIIGGRVAHCVTHDIGRLNNFVAFNGVAGGMFYRVKNYAVTDSEWGFVSRGGGSGDGEAFDLEGNNDNITFTRCLFHDADGPCFMLYQGAAHGNFGMVFTNCIWNGKSPRSNLGRQEIFNASPGAATANFIASRFYLSPGENLCNNYSGMSFVNCLVKNLVDAASGSNAMLTATSSASSSQSGNSSANAHDGDTATLWVAAMSSNEWLRIDFARPTIVNEFRIREAAGSAIRRYSIQCWDAASSNWVGCFNGRTIGADFMAPIVSRTTQSVRLLITATSGGNPGIAEFEAYNGVPNTIRWAVGNGAWDINTTPNWRDATGTPCNFVNGDAVLLDDTASGTSPITITLTNSVLPYGVATDNTARDFILTGSGSIGGDATVLKSGGGTLTVSCTNTFTGSTTVNGGILRAGRDSVANESGPFGKNSAVTLANTAGVVLDITGHDTQIGSLAGGGGGGGNVTLGAATLTIGGNNVSAAYGGAISSSGSPDVSLRIVGPGRQTLQRANTFTGRTVIDGGTLVVDESNGSHPDAKLGSVPITFKDNSISLLNGATFYRAGGNDGPGNINANRGIYLGPGWQYMNQDGGDTIINGIISGPGGLHKLRGNSYSILVLRAANTYSGDTKFISTGGFGYIRLGNAMALQNSAFDTSGSVNLDWNGQVNPVFGGLVNGGNLAVPGYVSTLTLNPTLAGVTKTYTGVLSGNMALVKTGPGTQVLGGGNTYSGGTTVRNGILLADNVTGSATGPGEVTVEIGATLGGGGTITGAVTAEGGAHLAPGGVSTVGTLTLTAPTLTFVDGAVLECELGDDSNDTVDLTDGASSIAFGSTATLNIIKMPGATLNPSGKTFVLFDYSGADPTLPTWTVTHSDPNWVGGAVSVDPTNTQVVLKGVRWANPTFEEGNEFSLNSSGDATFHIRTTNGVLYRMVYNDNLRNTNGWTNPVTPPFPDGWTNGSNAAIALQDTSATGVMHRFYRIESKPDTTP